MDREKKYTSFGNSTKTLCGSRPRDVEGTTRAVTQLGPSGSIVAEVVQRLSLELTVTKTASQEALNETNLVSRVGLAIGMA
jgi:hypothetical protein